MKNIRSGTRIARNVIYLLITSFLCSCFGPWNDGGKGTVSIAWGNATGRSFVQESDLADLRFDIILTGPGEKQEKSFTGTSSAVFTVNPGTWTINVKGYKPGTVDDKLMIMGIEQVKVNPGPNGTIPLPIYTVTEGDFLTDLNYGLTLNSSEPGVSSRTELFILKSDDMFRYDTGPAYIVIDRKIILIAEEDITLVKTGLPMSLDPDDRQPCFYITNGGELTLGLPGMTGTITLDGINSDNVSLVIVKTGGSLVMNDNVTVRNGVFSKDGAGVYVEDGASFTMNGGTITGNRVNNSQNGKGGGVFVESEAEFTNNGGTITGNELYNVYYEPYQIIAPHYRELDAGGVINGYISTTGTPLPDVPVTIKAKSISAGATEIKKVSTGPDRDFSGSQGDGKWAYLFERDKKIGVIFYTISNYDSSKTINYYLGSDAKVYLDPPRNNENIEPDPSDYLDLNIGQYSGYGWTAR